nr:aminodeoxychorismate lyase [Marinicella rhabdoformis]
MASSIKVLDWKALINRGLQYGDGIFETMRLVNGKVPLWQFHWHRFQQSAQYLNLNCPNEAEILKQIDSWFVAEEASHAVIKLTLFRQAKGRGYAAQHKDSDWILQSSPLPHENKKPFHLGLAQLQLAEQPCLAGIKHLNRLEQVFLARELQQSRFDEMLVCAQSGELIESVSQNVVLLKDDELYTPKTTRCGVSGVGLAWLKSHVTVKSVNIQVSELSSFDGLFLINSVRGISSVESVDGVKKFSTASSLHDRIEHSWNELMSL